MLANTAKIALSVLFAVRTAVGYKAEGLQEGATMVAPCFVNIGESENIDLLDLTVGGEYGSGDIVVQTLTAAGLADKTYTFQQNPRTKVWEWIDDDNVAVNAGEITFEPGVGLWIAAVDGSSITCSGGVSTSDREITLQEGATACGNFTPVELDLLSIIPGGKYGSGDIVIQTLTAAGLADKTYTFQQNPRTKVWEWIDDDNAAVGEGEVMFPAGAGLWIAAVDGVTITIPGPTL